MTHTLPTHPLQARFVVLLRDPAARALSGFNHNWHKGKLQQRNMELTGDLEVQHYLNLLNTTLQREMDTLSTCFSRYGGNSDEEAATAVWRCLQLEQLEVCMGGCCAWFPLYPHHTLSNPATRSG